MTDLKDAILDYRAEKNISQAVFAELCNVDVMTISRIENGKNKEMVAFLDAFKFDKTVLMVMGNDDVQVIRAAANVPTLSTISVDLLNTYEVVKNAVVVIAKEAVEKLEEVYGE